MSRSLVSIVVPLYNSETTIERALLSVLAQYYDNYEIIVINDGSTDNSKNIVEQFIKDHPYKRIVLVDHQHNSGVSKARNSGLKVAKGQWIAFLDSDDQWLPEKLTTQIDILKQYPNIDMIGCTRNGERINHFYFIKFKDLQRITATMQCFKNFFSTPTVVFKKELLNKSGYFPEGQRHAEEGLFFNHICFHFNAFLLNKSLVVTGDGKPSFGHSGLSSDLKKMEQGELSNIKDSYENRYINCFVYIVAVLYSLIKYLRRIIIVKSR